jgi:hypothetical protein
MLIRRLVMKRVLLHELDLTSDKEVLPQIISNLVKFHPMLVQSLFLFVQLPLYFADHTVPFSLFSQVFLILIQLGNLTFEVVPEHLVFQALLKNDIFKFEKAFSFQPEFLILGEAIDENLILLSVHEIEEVLMSGTSLERHTSKPVVFRRELNFLQPLCEMTFIL